MFNEELPELPESDVLKELIELNIIEDYKLSVPENIIIYLAMDLRRRREQQSKREYNENHDNEEYTTLYDKMTDDAYFEMKRRLEAKGYAILRVERRSRGMYITVRLRSGKIMNFLIVREGGESLKKKNPESR